MWLPSLSVVLSDRSPWLFVHFLLITSRVLRALYVRHVAGLTTLLHTLSANTGAIYSDFLTHIHQQLNDDIIAIRQGKHQLYRDIQTYTALWPSVWAEIEPIMRSAVLSRAAAQPLLDVLSGIDNSVRLALLSGEGE